VEIDSRYVGGRSKALTASLSPRQTMNYAAALGDNNPHYMDDSREGGICAPPMLAVALTWPLSSRFDIYWGDSDFPVEVQQRQVHYNESISWTRPMRSDEQLTIQGEFVSMRSHPAGTLITLRYEAKDQREALVFTEHIVGLFRGVALTDDGAESAPPPVIADAPTDAEEAWSTSIPIDSLAAHVYDGCTDIIFPIHTSVSFSRQVGLSDPIYQGTATLGLAVREILKREGDGDPAVLAAVHCGFRGMVFPGTTITLRVHAIKEEGKERVVYFDVLNGEGTLALRGGRVHLKKN
jgi:acyl dehydratase